MTHKLNRLTARKVVTEMEPGLHADGGGLYLRVGRGGAKSWCLRYMLQGKAREMGLVLSHDIACQHINTEVETKYYWSSESASGQAARHGEGQTPTRHGSFQGAT